MYKLRAYLSVEAFKRTPHRPDYESKTGSLITARHYAQAVVNDMGTGAFAVLTQEGTFFREEFRPKK
jgi:hypothetical protein